MLKSALITTDCSALLTRMMRVSAWSRRILMANPLTMQAGVLPGQDALPFLVSSGLSQILLGEVWALADPDNNGFLTKEGWYKAARLIGWLQKGGKSTVDESLISQREFADTAISLCHTKLSFQVDLTLRSQVKHLHLPRPVLLPPPQRFLLSLLLTGPNSHASLSAAPRPTVSSPATKLETPSSKASSITTSWDRSGK
jgi:hypothetical protein